MKALFTIFICSLLTSCAFTPRVETKLATLDSKSICCESTKDLEFKNINDVLNNRYKMSNQQVMLFEETKSYTLAVKLDQPIELLIETISDAALNSNQVFWPEILLLDSNYNPVRKIRFKGIDSTSISDCTHFGFLDIIWGKTFTTREDEKFMLIGTSYPSNEVVSMSIFKFESNPCYSNLPWAPFDQHIFRAKTSPDGTIRIKQLKQMPL